MNWLELFLLGVGLVDEEFGWMLLGWFDGWLGCKFDGM